MEKIITARHFGIQDDTRSHVADRLDELKTEYSSLTTARVVFDKQRSNFSAELIIHGSHLDVEATATANDPVVAFDKAFDKAEKQLHKRKDKAQDHKCVPLSQLECAMGEIEMEETEEEVTA